MNDAVVSAGRVPAVWAPEVFACDVGPARVVDRREGETPDRAILTPGGDDLDARRIAVDAEPTPQIEEGLPPKQPPCSTDGSVVPETARLRP